MTYYGGELDKPQGDIGAINAKGIRQATLYYILEVLLEDPAIGGFG